MSLKKLTSAVIALIAAVLFCGTAHAGNSSGYAWSENAGWVNFSPTGGGAAVYDDHLEGYVWHENIGWIRLGTFTAGTAHTYANTTNLNYGVNNDGSGTLSGYGWSENAGWINFSPSGGGVTIAGGSFDGYAWAENVGWIHFRNTTPAYNAVTTWGSGSPPPPAGLPDAPSGLTAQPVSTRQFISHGPTTATMKPVLLLSDGPWAPHGQRSLLSERMQLLIRIRR